MARYLKVTQERSAIGRLAVQGVTLRGLGITKRGRTAYVEDTPSNRGMVNAVGHLVSFEEVTQKERDAALSATRRRSYEVLED
jgi:large subunit ribosomal protein L30